MIRRPIRNLHNCREPRFCDVIKNGDEVYLETKVGKKEYKKIRWEDVLYQVNAVINDKED